MAAEHSFTFPLPLGLHARPASLIQEAAARFDSDIRWENLRTGASADAKSVLSLVGTDTQHGDPCRLAATGPDERAAVEALRRLVDVDLARLETEAEAAVPAAADVPRIIVLERAAYFQGLAAGPGIVRGPVFIDDPVSDLEAAPVAPARSADEELASFLTAVSAVESEIARGIRDAADKTEKAVGTAHLSMVRDPAFAAKVNELIRTERLSAAAAVVRAARFFMDRLQAGRSLYLRERMADVRDVAGRLVARISGGPASASALRLAAPSIVVAEDLAPSRFLAADRSLVLGLVLESAGLTSHTLIVARARGVPAAAALPGIRGLLKPGEDALLDGGRGLVVPSPGPAVSRYFEREMAAEERRREKRQSLAALPGRTADGRAIEIAANIADPEELEAAWLNGAEGVGLVRTEFLLLGRESPPGEEEQYEFYSRLAAGSGGRRIIVRTFDIGGDKPLPFLALPQERNPFMGFRGIRIYGRYEDLIRTQLRALLRAAVHGPLEVMFPMVSEVGEVVAAKSLLRSVAEDLSAAGIPAKPDIRTGMMVEVPSAALLIDKFAEHVDFFSVGSNDLLQYLFAADRGNADVRGLNEPVHPAFLRLLKTVVDTAHAAGRWVGLCGEAAGQARVLPLLVGLGFDELSMTSSLVPETKARLAALDVAACRDLVDAAVRLPAAGDVAALLDAFRASRAPAELLSPRLVRLHSESRTRVEALQELAIMMEENGLADSRAEFERDLWKREDDFATGIGFGLAIPHCRTASVRGPAIAVLRFDTPIDWGSSDGVPVDLAIMLAVPAAGQTLMHQKLLARLSRRLVHEEFRDALRAAANEDDAVRLIRTAVSE